MLDDRISLGRDDRDATSSGLILKISTLLFNGACDDAGGLAGCTSLSPIAESSGSGGGGCGRPSIETWVMWVVRTVSRGSLNRDDLRSRFDDDDIDVEPAFGTGCIKIDETWLSGGWAS